MKYMKYLMISVVALALLLGCAKDPVVNENTSTDPMGYSAAITSMTLGNYKDVVVDLAQPTVSQQEVDSLIENFFQANVPEELFIKDRAVEDGDLINLDYEGKKDGVAFEGGTAQGASLEIGSDTFIDGFEDQLIGVMPGTEVDLNLTFPEPYSNADLAGQSVVFTVTVNHIVPIISDEAIAAMDMTIWGIPECNTVEELRSYVNELLLEEAVRVYESNLESLVVEAIIAQTTFPEELPQEMRDKYELNYRTNLASSAALYEMDVESFVLAAYGITLDDLLSTYVDEAVKRSLVLLAIADAEGFKITDEELEASLSEDIVLYGASSEEEFLGESSKEDYREYLLLDVVLDFIMAEYNK
ncbi:MAG: FKBP-type peptidyl-prolyl cis-trans isomerase [Clostridium sp.]|jgi:trigger factor|nr:FKBP-type peptidyl-prolyl cis-trans isomerase [Clostridium sp.]